MISGPDEAAGWMWLLAASAVVGVAIGIPLYRLFLHPLASIPGPPLAAISNLYMFYFNVIKGGKFYLEVERLHHVYGPVVRIAPNEVHLSSPENYDKIYGPGGRKYDKDPGFYGILNTKFAMFSTVSSDVHRPRRARLDPFFSRRTVLTMEEAVQDKVAKLCRRVEDAVFSHRGQQEPFNLHAAMRALSIDVITEYAFDDCWGHLDRDDLGEWYPEMVKNIGATMWALQQFPFVLAVVEAIPPQIARKLDPVMRDMLDCKDKTRQAVVNVQRNIDSGYKPRQRTIFHELLDPQSAVPEHHHRPSIDEMAEESLSMCTAALDTTGNALTVAAYHVITNPEIYGKLRQELLERFPENDKTPLPFVELEKLPYLTGVVREGLRLSYGVIGRLPRVVPLGGLDVDGIHLPEGTVVGMSSYLQHRNPEAFPDPGKFDPTRWVDPSPSAKSAMSRCFVPFSRGARSCIGQNLAMCEIYVTLGTLFRRFGGLAARDVGELLYLDFLNAYHPEERQKLKVFFAAAEK